MLGEVLGKFVPSVLGGMHEPSHDPDLFHHGEVPVGGALREFGREFDQLGQRHRPVGVGQGGDHRTSAGRVPLLVLVEQVAHHSVDVGMGGGHGGHDGQPR